MKKNILILFLLIQALAVSSQQWIPDLNKKYSLIMPDGSNGFGYCFLTVNDTLFISGQFAKISNINASCIVKYYNGNYYPLTGGLYSTPFSLLYKNDTLYAAGSFMNADNKPGTQGLACWHHNNWWPIGSNSNCANCEVLELYQNKVFVGGNNLMGLAFGVIAWDGTNWVNAANLQPIDMLKRYSNDLLSGSSIGTGFMKFEGGTTWSPQPYGGISGSMFKAENDTINNLIYICGGFNFVNNNTIESHRIAIWDGFEWHSMGTVAQGIDCLKMYNGYLYAGFASDTLSDGTLINYIGRWDGNQWHPLGSGVNPGVMAMEEFHDTLFVGGGFTIAGGDSAYGLARWYMPDTNCAFLHPTIHTLAMQDTFCLSLGQVNVPFFNNNTYAQTWQWDFGDNSTSNIQNPVHTYTNDSAYTITVTVTQDGCTKTDTAHIWVNWCSLNQEFTKESLNFKVYPNPTGGDFTIECTLPTNKTGKVKAFRNTGSQLGEHPLESGLNNFIMPSSNWNDSVILVGVYIDSKQVLVEKVIKKSEY
ncbi:MAG: PKD domain-containing protein [Bacteroidia bacterium]|nr:PKD domain-containing protein [Bacteroidia bacterium]